MKKLHDTLSPSLPGVQPNTWAARAANRSASARSDRNRWIAAASACGSSGGTSSAFSPSRSISRMAGRSEAMMGCAAAMYSNIFRGDVKDVPITDRVSGNAQTEASGRYRHRSAGDTGPMNLPGRPPEGP